LAGGGAVTYVGSSLYHPTNDAEYRRVFASIAQSGADKFKSGLISLSIYAHSPKISVERVVVVSHFDPAPGLMRVEEDE